MGTELEDFIDAMPNFSSRLLSVNYSLFGNHRLWQVGESSLHYFIYNYSQNYASDYVKFIPHINEEEKKSILLLFKELESKRKDHYGRLISFIFPKNKIENYLYNSLVDGKMSSIKKIPEFDLLSFCDINDSQARIIDFNNMDESLSIEIFEDEEFLIPYKNKINEILNFH